MTPKHTRNRLRWALLLSGILVTASALAAVMGTAAWLTSQRSLSTLTKIDFVTLTLEGRTEDSVPVNLGVLPIGEAKEMPFRIVTKKNANYILQLAHTTKLPLTDESYTADEWAKKTTPIKEANAQEKQHHAETYGTYTNVQINAEPLYWLSNRTANATTGIDYYVLVVNWKSGTTAESVINKDTEMVYLSASLLTTNTGTTGGTGNAESSEPTA